MQLAFVNIIDWLIDHLTLSEWFFARTISFYRNSLPCNPSVFFSCCNYFHCNLDIQYNTTQKCSINVVLNDFCGRLGMLNKAAKITWPATLCRVVTLEYWCVKNRTFNIMSALSPLPKTLLLIHSWRNNAKIMLITSLHIPYTLQYFSSYWLHRELLK